MRKKRNMRGSGRGCEEEKKGGRERGRIGGGGAG